jgi:hypothetical protein
LVFNYPVKIQQEEGAKSGANKREFYGITKDQADNF